MSERNYIVIEGVIGAGKTTLATLLGERLEAKLVLEQHEENPFLVDFYRDPEHFAFQTELFFLLSRYRQQTEEFTQTDLFHQYTIADYHFAKNRIFANITLDDRELALYDHVAAILERDVRTPDIVVYMQAGVERLMRNIRIRNRSYERDISQEYIRSLVEAYNYFFFHYEACPLLVVNTNELDFVRHADQLDDLLEQILNAPEGTTYYNPAGR